MCSPASWLWRCGSSSRTSSPGVHGSEASAHLSGRPAAGGCDGREVLHRLARAIPWRVPRKPGGARATDIRFSGSGPTPPPKPSGPPTAKKNCCSYSHRSEAGRCPPHKRCCQTSPVLLRAALPQATGKTVAQLSSPAVHLGSYLKYEGARSRPAMGQNMTPAYCPPGSRRRVPDSEGALPNLGRRDSPAEVR